LRNFCYFSLYSRLARWRAWGVAVVSTSESPSPPGVPVGCTSLRLPLCLVFSPSMLPLMPRPVHVPWNVV
jgi:hypothetical protein